MRCGGRAARRTFSCGDSGYPAACRGHAATNGRVFAGPGGGTQRSSSDGRSASGRCPVVTQRPRSGPAFFAAHHAPRLRGAARHSTYGADMDTSTRCPLAGRHAPGTSSQCGTGTHCGTGSRGGTSRSPSAAGPPATRLGAHGSLVAPQRPKHGPQCPLAGSGAQR